MVAKMCATGGELWLSGVPTRATYSRYFEPKAFSIQICCFAGSPKRKSSAGSQGIEIPTALQVNVNMDAGNMQTTVERQIKEHLYLVTTSLLSGDNVLIHCRAGCHRAAIVSATFRAILTDKSFAEAQLSINQVRFVEIPYALSHYGPASEINAWIRGLVVDCQRTIRPTLAAFAKRGQEDSVRIPVAWGFSGVSIHTHTHALIRDPQSEELIPFCQNHQKVDKAGFKNVTSTVNDQEAISWAREFCKHCARHIPASWRVRAGFGPLKGRKMDILDSEVRGLYGKYQRA